MASPMTSSQVLDREYLQMRAKVLELAATFDRLGRSAGAVDGDPRLSLIHEALQVLMDERNDRAEQVQLIFSRQYDDDWQQDFQITPR